MKKKISVIIPVYNNQELIVRCLESIMQQTYHYLEIIIVDDGSTDQTGQICHDLAQGDSRIQLISQQNAGVAHARNTGLNHATGDYISFIDSDDYISVTMYAVMLEAAETHQAEIVECGYALVDNDDHILFESNFIDDVISDRKEMVEKHLRKINTKDYNCNKLFARKIFSELRFPDYKYSEDYYMNVFAILNASIKVTISEVLYFYRQHGGSATNQKINFQRLDTILSGKAVFKRVNDTYPELGIYVTEYILTYCRMFYLKAVNQSDPMLKTLFYQVFTEEFDRHRLKLLTSNIPNRVKINLVLFRMSPQFYTWLYLNLKRS